MKKSRITEEQKVYAPKPYVLGGSTQEMFQKMNISEALFYYCVTYPKAANQTYLVVMEKESQRLSYFILLHKG